MPTPPTILTQPQAEMLGNGPAGGSDGKSISVASSRERRRFSIKAAKVERRRQELEVVAMHAEDARSKLENNIYRVSRREEGLSARDVCRLSWLAVVPPYFVRRGAIRNQVYCSPGCHRRFVCRLLHTQRQRQCAPKRPTSGNEVRKTAFSRSNDPSITEIQVLIGASHLGNRWK